jgi:hypothetical protein
MSHSRMIGSSSFEEDDVAGDDDELEQPEEYDPTKRFARVCHHTPLLLHTTTTTNYDVPSVDSCCFLSLSLA